MNIVEEASLIITPNAYKEGKLYALKPFNGDGDGDFTRASDATRTNENGELENTPVNMLSYSQDFTDATWTKTATQITNDSTSTPNEIKEYSKMSTLSVANQCYINQNIASKGDGNEFTFSVYAKADDYNYIALVGLNPFTQSYFDVLNGVTLDDGGVSTSIEDVGYGWFLCTATLTSTTTSKFCGVYLSQNGTSLSLGSVADGLGVFIAQSQVVNGTTAKPYFPTTDRLNVPRINYPIDGGCPHVLLEPQRTNSYLNSGVLVTQSNTTTSSTYTVSFYGTGTITFTGSYSGVLVGNGDKVNLTFAATSGTLISTVTGIVNNAQLEQGSYPTTYIPTNGAIATRLKDECAITSPIGTTKITEYFDDNTTNEITVIPVTYQMPFGRIKQVIFE